MGSPVDLTLGRCSNGSQVVPSSDDEYHNDGHRNVGASTYPEDLREAAQEYLRTLQEERRKVEGFKRELPLCIQLLDDAIKTAEEKLVHGKDVVLPMALRLSCSSEKENDSGVMSPESRRPTLEEFMPLKRREQDGHASDISSDGEGEDYCGTTKKTHPAWMAEAQLWNQTTSQSTDVVHDEKKMMPEMMRDPDHSEQEQSSVTSSQQRPAGGAFVPWELQQHSSIIAMPVVSRPRARTGGFCADLNLCVQDSERPATSGLHPALDVEVGSIDAAAAAQQTPDAVRTRKDMGSMVGNVDMSGAGTTSSGGGAGISSSSARKARRCWSPELHRRFVNALHQLGGSHVATPKQLRELMKVDGLTNDEVKSHLQKYRLHTRRPSSSQSPRESATAAAGQQLLVVGGIWMPPQHASPGAASPAAANSHPGGSYSGVSDPSQFCHSARTLPLDYFAACINNGTPAAGPSPMQMLLHRQPIFESLLPGTSQSQTSPKGPLQITSQLSGATQGSSSETYESGEEEDKSQSTSWNFCRRSTTQKIVSESNCQTGNVAVRLQPQLVHNSG